MSQERWAAAHAAGIFADEIAPLEMKSKKGTFDFVVDEHPRVILILPISLLFSLPILFLYLPLFLFLCSPPPCSLFL